MNNLTGQLVKYKGETAQVVQDVGDSDIKITTNPGGEGFWVDRSKIVINNMEAN